MMKHIYIASCVADGGIYHYIFNGGSLTLMDKTELDRPMYMVIRDGKMYVLLREIDSDTHFGGLISFDIDGEGRLVNPSDVINTKGIVPCHLEVTEKGIYVVNYLSGNIVMLPDTVAAHSGKGVHPKRQEAPHTHFTMRSPDKKHILCTDLGIDTVFLYDENLNEQYTAKVPDGCGARHLCFSEDSRYLYCVNELSNDVSVFEYNGGKPILKGTYAAIPDFKGESTAAAIRIKDGYLYISNRGADTISRFKISGEKLTLLENTPCGGKSPRDFGIIDDYIFCTNEQTNNVTVFKLENGKPVSTDISVSVDSPLCVCSLV
ncbi:MAG: lactonase family protein [Clostridia bacterium]|nr:lactonase family protein [Clostridia bacterium]